jgi:hypothetical protein
VPSLTTASATPLASSTIVAIEANRIAVFLIPIYFPSHSWAKATPSPVLRNVCSIHSRYRGRIYQVVIFRNQLAILDEDAREGPGLLALRIPRPGTPDLSLVALEFLARRADAQAAGYRASERESVDQVKC